MKIGKIQDSSKYKIKYFSYSIYCNTQYLQKLQDYKSNENFSNKNNTKKVKI